MFLSKWVICRFHVNLPGCTRNVFFSERGVESKDMSHGYAVEPLLRHKAKISRIGNF